MTDWNNNAESMKPLRYSCSRLPSFLNKRFVRAERNWIIPYLHIILEIGSGLGRWSDKLSCNKLILTDISLSALKRNNASEYKVVCSADALPFKSNIINFIFMANVLTAMEYGSRAWAVKEIHRTIRTGGRLYLIDMFFKQGLLYKLLANRQPLSMNFLQNIGRRLQILRYERKCVLGLPYTFVTFKK